MEQQKQQKEKRLPFYALDPLLHDSLLHDSLLHDSLLHDPADRLDQDAAGDGAFTPKLYRFLTSAIQPPYSVSIHGNWGSGKTTLMLALQQKFKADGYPVFWFNPWEFEQVDDILHAFLSQLTRTAESRWKKTVKAGGIFGLTLLGTSVDLIARLTTGNKLTIKNVDYLAEKASKEVEKTFEQFEGKYKAQHPLEMLRDDFKTFTVDTAKAHDQKPLIVFIDDLDRCLPDNALTLLEAIKNLFVIKGAQVLFISGIDTHIARQFIIERYQGLDPSFAYNYFKKIFNFTVSVPSLSTENYQQLLKKRYDEMVPAFSQDGSAEQLPANFAALMTTQLSQLLIAGGIKSIRQIYNVFQSCLFFFWLNPAKEGTDAGLQNFIYLGLLTLKECWPDLFDDLQKEARREPDGRLFLLLRKGIEGYANAAQLEPLIECMEVFCRQNVSSTQPTAQPLLDI